MSRCYYPVWHKHKVKFAINLAQTNKKLTFKISEIADRYQGRDGDFVVRFFDPNSAVLDPEVLSNIFSEEDVMTYTERVTNQRTVLENFCELRNQEHLEEIVTELRNPEFNPEHFAEIVNRKELFSKKKK